MASIEAPQAIAGVPIASWPAIYLHLDSRRREIGRKLLAAVTIRARGRGYRELSLRVLRENQRARSF